MSKTTRKYTKKELLQDEVFKKKGHAHEQKHREPIVCPACNGWESEGCPVCQGEGELYEWR